MVATIYFALQTVSRDGLVHFFAAVYAAMQWGGLSKEVLASI